MSIFLLGYMASGKSTIGKKLSEKLSYQFIDLDDYIEHHEKAAISDIFKNNGEIYFRKIETQYLKEILEKEGNFVVALGGGTPCYGDNMSSLLNAENTTTIYLKTSIPTVIDRLRNGKEKRPLVAHLDTDEALNEFIGKHLFERSHYYNQAEAIIATDDKTEKEIMESIIFELF